LGYRRSKGVVVIIISRSGGSSRSGGGGGGRSSEWLLGIPKGVSGVETRHCLEEGRLGWRAVVVVEVVEGRRRDGPQGGGGELSCYGW